MERRARGEHTKSRVLVIAGWKPALPGMFAGPLESGRYIYVNWD
jgi:hypothetical protein